MQTTSGSSDGTTPEHGASASTTESTNAASAFLQTVTPFPSSRPRQEARPKPELKVVEGGANTHTASRPGGGDGLQRDRDGRLLINEANALHAFEQLGVSLSFDQFSHEEHIKGLDGYGPHLDDAAMAAFRLKVWSDIGLKYQVTDFYAIVSVEARRNSRHPVKSYLDSLRWDGTKRIDTWLHTYLGAEANEVNSFTGRSVLIAAVRRIRRPGSKFDTMLVLEGPQYLGKSTSLQALCPDPQWFSNSFALNQGTKELMEQTANKWIVEIGELAGMRRSEVEHVKALLSRQVDEARLAYGRRTEKRPRQFIFIATTNKSNYLLDPSGNRRFWPVKVGLNGEINCDAIVRDRDKLWAEASAREALGEAVHPDAAMSEKLAEQQKQREISDEWDGLIRAWLDESSRQTKITSSASRQRSLRSLHGALFVSIAR